MALTDNLVAYYKLDGNSNDSVGSNNGTDTNVSYSSSYGKINQGTSFNGSSTIISVPLNIYSIFNGSNNWSFSCWIKYNTTGTNLCIFRSSNGDSNNGYNTNFNIYKISGENFSVARADGSGTINICTTSSTYSSGIWYHLTATYDGSNIKLYVNAGTPTSLSSTLIASSGNVGRFGLWVENSTSYYWYNGYIDEVGIWSRALTSTEVSQLYNGGAGNQYPFTTPTNSNFLMFT